jgi:hypothetical protein
MTNTTKTAKDYTMEQIREIKAILDAEGVDWKDFIRNPESRTTSR